MKRKPTNHTIAYSISKHSATVGRRNFLLTGRNLRQDQAQPSAATGWREVRKEVRQGEVLSASWEIPNSLSLLQHN